jgi:hypothetical protein
MSSVFGFATVVKTEKISEERVITLLHDKDTDIKECVAFNKEFPVGTQVYWEFDCRTKKTNYIVYT